MFIEEICAGLNNLYPLNEDLYRYWITVLYQYGSPDLMNRAEWNVTNLRKIEDDVMYNSLV